MCCSFVCLHHCLADSNTRCATLTQAGSAAPLPVTLVICVCWLRHGSTGGQLAGQSLSKEGAGGLPAAAMMHQQVLYRSQAWLGSRLPLRLYQGALLCLCDKFAHARCTRQQVVVQAFVAAADCQAIMLCSAGL